MGQSLRHELKLIGQDLPPSWDGEPVRWSQWKSGPELIICPTPPLTDIACDQCGVIDTTKSLLCWGQRMENGPQEDRVLRQLPSGRTYWRNTTRPATWVRDLVAYRCPHCKHDRVWDKRTDEWWDLDESDYVPAGSYPPVTASHQPTSTNSLRTTPGDVDS